MTSASPSCLSDALRRLRHGLRLRLRGAASPDGRFAAFISYATDPDAPLATRLHDGLESFDGGLIEGRSRRVFHDVAVLGAHPDLGAKLAESILHSDHLVLLAGPASQASPWVIRELRCFLGTADAFETPLTRDAVSAERLQRLIIVQTGGTLRWTPAAGDPRPALAPEVESVLRAEPLVVDFRGWQRYDANTWRMQVVRVLAAIRGVDVDAIWGEHLRRERRKRLLLTTAIASIALLAIGVAVSAVGWASSTRQLVAGGLLATARESIAADPVRALLLADRAIRTLEDPIPADAWRAAPLLASLPPVKRYLAHVPAGAQRIAISDDGAKLAAAGPHGLAVWDTATGALRCAADGPFEADRHLVVHADGTLDLAGASGWERRSAGCVLQSGQAWRGEAVETFAASDVLGVAGGQGLLRWRDAAGWHAARLAQAWLGWPAEDPEGRWHLDAAALHPARPEVALGTRSGAVAVCALGPGARVRCTPLGDPQLGSIVALAYSPDGTRLLAAGPSGVALRQGGPPWKPLTEASIRALAVADDAVWSVQRTQGGSTVARQVDGSPASPLLGGIGRGLMDEAVIARTGLAAAIYDRFSGTPAVALLDPRNPPLVRVTPMPDPHAMSGDAQAGVFVAGTDDGNVLRWQADASFGRLHAFTPPPEFQNCLVEAPVLSPDGGDLALLACSAPTLLRLSDGSATPIPLPPGEPAGSWLAPIAWIGSRHIVFHSAAGHTYLRLDRDTLRWQPLGSSTAQRIVRAPEGAWIIKAGSLERLGEDGPRWQATGPTSLIEDRIGGDEMQHDFVTGDGRFLVAVRVTGEVRIHAVAHGHIAPAKTLRIDRSYNAATGPAGTLLVATTRGIQVIRLDTAEIITTLPLDPTDACPSAYYSIDEIGRGSIACQVQHLSWEGHTLRVLFKDRVVTWDLDPEQVRRRVCEVAGTGAELPDERGLVAALRSWWGGSGCR